MSKFTGVFLFHTSRITERLLMSYRCQISMPYWVTCSQIWSNTLKRRQELVSCCLKCAKESDTCFTPVQQM